MGEGISPPEGERMEGWLVLVDLDAELEFVSCGDSL